MLKVQVDWSVSVTEAFCSFPAFPLLSFPRKRPSGFSEAFVDVHAGNCWARSPFLSVKHSSAGATCPLGWKEAAGICSKCKRSHWDVFLSSDSQRLIHALSNSVRNEMRRSSAVRPDRLTWKTPDLSDFRACKAAFCSCSIRAVGVEKGFSFWMLQKFSINSFRRGWEMDEGPLWKNHWFFFLLQKESFYSQMLLM